MYTFILLCTANGKEVSKHSWNILNKQIAPMLDHKARAKNISKDFYHWLLWLKNHILWPAYKRKWEKNHNSPLKMSYTWTL